MSTDQVLFNSGEIYVLRNDIVGATPLQIAQITESSVEFSGTTKELTGKYLIAKHIEQTGLKITGKFKTSDINAVAVNTLLCGGTLVDGQTLVADSEAHTIPASTAYTVTVTNSAHFSEDFGVVDADTLIPYSVTSDTVAGGLYSVTSGGVYTFDEDDKSKDILISYAYSASSTGKTASFSNAVAGTAPKFKLVLRNEYEDQQFVLVLHKCVCTKFSLAMKAGDFAGGHEYDFQAMEGSTGVVYDWFSAR